MIRTTPFSLIFLQDYVGNFGNRQRVIAETPFSTDDLQKRVMITTKDKKKGMPAFYIDARAVDHRLNLMFGRNWGVSFRSLITEELYVSTASLWIAGTIREDLSSELVKIKKYDGSIEINELAATAAQAASYKRAAVKFGIGAYLYDFKDQKTWEELDPEYTKQFKDPDINPEKLPAFAKPVDGPKLVINELTYLCNSKDSKDIQDLLKTYWGIESFKDLDRDDSIRLASCIARVSDYIELTGKALEDIKKEYWPSQATKNGSTVGFKATHD